MLGRSVFTTCAAVAATAAVGVRLFRRDGQQSLEKASVLLTSAALVGGVVFLWCRYAQCFLPSPPSDAIAEHSKAGAINEQSSPIELLPGVRVRVVDLKIDIEANGKVGLCEKWGSPPGTWRVGFDDGSKVPFHPKNLVAIEALTPGSDGKFIDHSFPPVDVSLGMPKDVKRSFIGEEDRRAATWIRLPDVIRRTAGLSFDARVPLWDNISPQDLSQGQVGNCWLLASVAALAEFPSAVRNLFVEADVEEGRYIVKLFDMDRAAWEHVEIDDYIPCVYRENKTNLPYTTDENMERTFKWEDMYNEDGSKKPIPMQWEPLFGRPKGMDMWAVLLEKAMAKFVGSYAWIAGGAEQYALIAFTGMPLVYCFLRQEADEHVPEAKWNWYGAQYRGRDEPAMPCAPVRGDMPWLSDDSLWSRLQLYAARNYMMTAAITNFARPATHKGFFRRDGLVLGHAYTLLDFRSATTDDSTEEREVLEWTDQDGDRIGLERVGDCVYNRCNGMRWQPSGVQDTVQIIDFCVSADMEEFRATDSMGVTCVGFCPKEHCAAAAQIWERAAKTPNETLEQEVLSAGSRVRFKGLKKQKELNGRLGEVLGVKSEGTEQEPATYLVKLIIDIGHYDVGTLADEYNYWEAVVKRQNLELVRGIPGARGGAVRFVMLRNPHGEGDLVTHADGSSSHCTKWRGDWCDTSRLWKAFPDIAQQVGYEPANDGRFWMSWEDFRRVFDRATILTKTMGDPASEAFELEGHQYKEDELCLSLKRMVELEELNQTTPSLLLELKKACVSFDPFDELPSFLDDGGLDTRLRWLSTKPGRLESFLEDTASAGELGRDDVLQRVYDLRLEKALGPCGHI